MGKSYQLAVLEALGFKAVAALIATPTPGDTLTGVGRTHNAQLRGEQRLHPHLKHCAINTKFEVEAKMPGVVNPS